MMYLVSMLAFIAITNHSEKRRSYMTPKPKSVLVVVAVCAVAVY